MISYKTISSGVPIIITQCNNHTVLPWINMATQQSNCQELHVTINKKTITVGHSRFWENKWWKHSPQ